MNQPTDLRTVEVTTKRGNTFTLVYSPQGVADALVEAHDILSAHRRRKNTMPTSNNTVVPAISQ